MISWRNLWSYVLSRAHPPETCPAKIPASPLMITSPRHHDLSFDRIFTSGFWNDARLSHYQKGKVTSGFRSQREEGRVFGGGGVGGGDEAGAERSVSITITHLVLPPSPPLLACGHLPSSDTGCSLSNYLQ